jgi:hypothetical protein
MDAAATNVEGSGLGGSKAKLVSDTTPSAGKKTVSAGARRAAALSAMKAKKAKKQAAIDSSADTAKTPSIDLAATSTVPKSVMKEKAAARREAKRAGGTPLAKAKKPEATSGSADAADTETSKKQGKDAPNDPAAPSSTPKNVKEKAAAMREAKRVAKLAQQADAEKGNDSGAGSAGAPSDDNATRRRKSTSADAKRAAIMALREQKQKQSQKAHVAKLEGKD